jgi:murein peptide amidase A
MEAKTGHRSTSFRIFIVMILIETKIHVIKADTKEGSSALEQVTFYSVKGREIKTFVFHSGEPTTLVIGGIHGDERSGVCLAEELVKRILSRQIIDFKGRVIIMPLINPDGFAAGTRANARGIDINRNFPTKDYHQGYFKKSFYPGEQAASEPETVAVLQMAARFQPRLILTFHSEMGCVNYDGPAENIAKAISAKDGLPVRKELGYRTPGSLGTYFGVERNIPTITLELIPEDNQWERHGKAILEAIGVVN